MGYAVIVAAGVLLIYLLRQLPKLFRGTGGEQQKGKWIYDRSLGGKAVSHHFHQIVTVSEIIAPQEARHHS